MNLLHVDGLSAGYGQLQALWEMSFTVEKGETLLLLGPNGAGKSTTFRSIVGMPDMQLTAGSITFAGENMNGVPYHRRLRDGIAWSPEGRKLFGNLSVRENLYISSHQAGTSKRFNALLEQAIDLFPFIADRLSQRADTLSGGQQQMIAVARALVREPRLILLDEPSLGLAPSVTLELRGVIQRLSGMDVTTIVAEQNTSWLEGLEGRVLFIREGRIISEGGIELLESQEAVRQAFLGS